MCYCKTFYFNWNRLFGLVFLLLSNILQSCFKRIIRFWFSLWLKVCREHGQNRCQKPVDVPVWWNVPRAAERWRRVCYQHQVSLRRFISKENFVYFLGHLQVKRQVKNGINMVKKWSFFRCCGYIQYNIVSTVFPWLYFNIKQAGPIACWKVTKYIYWNTLGWVTLPFYANVTALHFRVKECTFYSTNVTFTWQLA